jgi:histidinol phosphatase-like PHP family hydrolase
VVSSGARTRRRADSNSVIAGLLRDLSAAQPSPQQRWGYARAADAVAALAAPIDSFVQPDGTLRKIPHVGPSSARVILEVLRTGASPTVERAVAESGKAAHVAKSRGLRENFLSRAEVVTALKNRRLRGVSATEYRGDLQMHSTYSDGTQTLEVIVETGIARGYEYAAVTDHSYGLPIARGVSMADLARQHREIDRLNRKYAGRFRLIKGIEANILADGTVDMTPRERQELELVVAAPHSALRSTADQTQRILTAVRTPGVHILGHPRGRKYGVRPGVTADWGRVFAVAARATVAIEIDGDPRRQDIDYQLARRALAAGCLFALDSDAHAPDEWEFAETAIAHARRAGIPSERVINCWPLDFLMTWAAGRKAATGRR